MKKILIALLLSSVATAAMAGIIKTSGTKEVRKSNKGYVIYDTKEIVTPEYGTSDSDTGLGRVTLSYPGVHQGAVLFAKNHAAPTASIANQTLLWANGVTMKYKAGATTYTLSTDPSTAVSVSSPSQGDLLFYNGAAWTKLAKGANHTTLKVNGNTLQWE